MKFGNLTALHALWLALAVALFFWFAWRQRRRALELYAAPHLLPVMAPTLNERLGLVRAVLVTAAIVSLVLALASPRWGYHWQEVRRRGIDIFVALDVSKSMLAQDVRPNRLEQSKFAVRDLLKMAGGDRVGLIAFAGTAFVSCPLTLDHAAVQLMLDDTTPDIIPVGGTDIAGAIKEAIHGFTHAADRNRALILITDGEATEGDAVSAAKTAAKLGIKIFTIGIGTTSGELIPVPTEGGSHEFLKDREGRVVQTKLDEATLQQIALTTQGYYVHAASGNFGIDTIYRNGIEPMAPKDFETKMEQRFEERFQWPLGLALALLVAEALLRERRKETTGFVSPVAASSRTAAVLIGFMMLNLSLFTAHPSLFAADITEPPPKLYNEGNADYRQQQFDEAAKAYQQTLVTQDKNLQQRAFYNLGNACFRQANPKETADPKRAEELFKQAVTCYEDALALNPKDEDAAFNKKLTMLRLQKLQEQQRQQQQQQQQQNQQQKQDKQQQAQAGQQQQKQDQQKQQKAGEQQQQQEQKQQQQQQQQQPKPGDQPKPEKKPGDNDQSDQQREMSEQEAKRLLDSLRDEEKQWKERNPQHKAGDREPEKNW